MQRLEQRSPDAILLLFLIAQTVDITMPVFALLALVAYSVSLALIVPGLLQKNGGWRRMAIISAVIALVCHAIALEARILPDGDSGQNLSLLNVGSLVSLMICTVMTIVASRNRGWLLLPIVYAFALINLALATFMAPDACRIVVFGVFPVDDAQSGRGDHSHTALVGYGRRESREGDAYAHTALNDGKTGQQIADFQCFHS